MCKILSYDQIFRLSSAQCLYASAKNKLISLVEGAAASRNSSAKVAPHKIDYIL